MSQGIQGASGTFGTHKPSRRAGVQHGMGCIGREGARKAKSALCPVKGWGVMLEVMRIH